MEIDWSELALESYSDIVDYIQIFFGANTAQKSAQELREYIDKLKNFPYLGKPIYNTSKIGMIRCVFYKQNHIYYQVTENKIEILLVWDGRQDPERLEAIINALA